MATELEVKMSVFGNAETGKTALLQRYLTGSFTHQYVQTIGINYLDKEVQVQGNPVKLTLWDIGGEDEFQNMIPTAAEGAHICMLLFDLTNKSSLSALKTWFQTVRKYNDMAYYFIVGTKFDLFEMQDESEKKEVIDKARKYAKSMGGVPLVFTSSEKGINVNRLFKLALSFVFGLGDVVERIKDNDKPIIDYEPPN